MGRGDADGYNGKLIECISDPYRCHLLIEIMRGCSRASDLHERCPEIPRATMYRHLRRLTEDGLIVVVGEERKRGTVERTYAPAEGAFGELEAVVASNSTDAYLTLFLQFVLGFVREFRDYCDDPGADIAADRSGFSVAPTYATDEEVDAAMARIGEEVQKLAGQGPGEGRRLRLLGVILSPPRDGRGG